MAEPSTATFCGDLGMSETGLGTSLKRLTQSEGDWVLEVERLVPFGRHLHQPVKQKIEGASLIGRHMRAVPELSEMVELTERLMSDEAPAEAYELWKGEWLDVEMVRILSLANARAPDVVRSGGQAEGGASRKAVAVLERSQSKLQERLDALEQGEQFEKMAALIERLTEKVSALEAKLGMDPAEAQAFAAEAKAKAKANARGPSQDKSSSGSPEEESSSKSDSVSESAPTPASAGDESSVAESAPAPAEASSSDDSSVEAAEAGADHESSASKSTPAPAEVSSNDDSPAETAEANAEDENSAAEAADSPAEASTEDDRSNDESGEAGVDEAGGTDQEKPQRPAKRMRPPTKTAMRQSLVTLIGEEIALKERSKHIDFTDGTFFRAELHDDDGLLVGTMISDIEATVKLACMLMMLPEDEVQEQLASNEASEDSVETMSEIFNTMSATINNVKSNPHVRTTPLGPLNPQEFEWVKTTKRRIDLDVGCGGVISICAV